MPLARRVLGSEASIERDFLVAAVCNLEQAAQYLDVLTPEHFADPGKREVFVRLKEAMVAGKGEREAVLWPRCRPGRARAPRPARCSCGW